MRHGQLDRQRGAALLYILTLLTIVGALVGLTWRTIRSNNNLASLNRGDAQARLLAMSGLDYALAKIGAAGTDQNLGFATEDLKYRLDGDNLGFQLQVRTWGLFARVNSMGKFALPVPGRTVEAAGALGQALDLGRLPALGLLNHEGNMVLAGNAQVTGPVMLWRGDVRKATDYHVRWTGKGGSGHTGSVWDSTATAWKWAIPDFGRAEGWIKSQERMLALHDFENDGDFDSGSVQDLALPDSAFLSDTILINARVTAKRFLQIGSGVKMQNCKLLSQDIRIEGDAVLDRALVFAGRNLSILGGQIHGGQFLAGDSLRLASDRPLAGYPVFYTRGRIVKPGQPDSSMVGAMDLQKAQGVGIFLAPFNGRPIYDQAIRLVVHPEVRLTGFLYCGGYVQMEGSLEGSLICRNLKFEYKGTIWLGHLKDAQITSAAGKRVLSAPLLFPGFEPIVIGVHGP